MFQNPNCPACGGPLPETQSQAGVVCEYCGVFIRTEQPLQTALTAVPMTDQPPNHEIEVIYPERTAFSEPELKWDSFSQWRGIKFPRWRTLKRSLVISILIVVGILCFSCICLLSALNKPLQQLFNSISR